MPEAVEGLPPVDTFWRLTGGSFGPLHRRIAPPHMQHHGLRQRDRCRGRLLLCSQISESVGSLPGPSCSARRSSSIREALFCSAPPARASFPSFFSVRSGAQRDRILPASAVDLVRVRELRQINVRARFGVQRPSCFCRARVSLPRQRRVGIHHRQGAASSGSLRVQCA